MQNFLLFLPLLSRLFLLFVSSTPCEDAQLPFYNTKSFVDPPDPFFSCFTCTPDNLTPFLANRRCSDGSDAEAGIDVECSSTCQTQIDTYFAECIAEDDQNIFVFSDLVGRYFNKWGKCDFGYQPTTCDQALVTFTSVLAQNSIACAENFIPDPPVTCDGVCTDAIQRLIQDCSGKQFLVRSAGSELPDSYKLGSVHIFNKTLPQIDDIIWQELSTVCLDYTRTLLGTNVVSQPPGGGDSEGGTPSPTPAGGGGDGGGDGGEGGGNGGNSDNGGSKMLDLGTSKGQGIVAGAAAGGLILIISTIMFLKRKSTTKMSVKKAERTGNEVATSNPDV